MRERTIALVYIAAILFGIALCLLPLLARRAAAQTNRSVHKAAVVRVVDGDTVQVVVEVWFRTMVSVAVRIKGIDTPETSAQKCVKERDLGVQATALTSQLLPKGSMVILKDVQEDKYSGRVDAHIITMNGASVADILVKQGLAKPYTGKGSRPDWCDGEKKGGKEEKT